MHPIRALTALALALATSANAGGRSIDAADRMACVATADGTAAFSALLAELADGGGEIRLPAGCVVTQTAALTLPSRVTVRCEDASAGFRAAARVCRGGAFLDAACTSDGDCPGGGPGSCRYDVPATLFAPDAGHTYTMLQAAPGSVDVQVIGCSFWTGQRDPYFRCNDAHPTLGERGKPCLAYCATGGLWDASWACDQDADCGAPGVCTAVGGSCPAQGDTGYCNAPPGRPSGPGRIDVLDLGPAIDAHASDDRIVDWLDGDFAIKVGTGRPQLLRNRTDLETPFGALATRPVAPPFSASTLTYETDLGIAPTLRGETALYSLGMALIEGNVAVGATYGLRSIGSTSKIVANDLTALGPDGYALYFSNGYNEITGNVLTALARGSTAAFQGRGGGQQDVLVGNYLAGFFGYRPEPGSGSNVTVALNRIFGGAGAKVTCMGAGCNVSLNYNAWGTGTYGTCDAGPNEGGLCAMATDCPTAGAGTCDPGGTCSGATHAACDCPSSRCTRFPVIDLGTRYGPTAAGTGHANVQGNLTHTDVGGVALVRIEDVGLRCLSGAKLFHRCTNNDRTDCPGACLTGPGKDAACAGPRDCPCATDADCNNVRGGSCLAGVCTNASACAGGGACGAQTHDFTTIKNNQMLAGGVGVDGSPISAASATRVTNLDVGGNQFSGALPIAIAMPDPARCTNCNVVGNDFGSGAGDRLVGWDWRMGWLAGNTGLNVDDDDGQVVTFTNADGGPLAPGDVVEVAAGASNAVRGASPGSGTPIGVVVNAPVAGGEAKVMLAGKTTCTVASDTDVKPGDRLTVSSSTAKAGSAAGSAEDGYAVALAPRSGPGVRCLVRPAPAPHRTRAEPPAKGATEQ